ncbi:MAG: cystathionine beta-lyase [Alphaproteobacteria bacterium]|nr:cystathionine beta-lyase [Alphaproteobacteria bacterium]
MGRGRHAPDRNGPGVSENKPSTRLIHTRGPRLDPPVVNPPLERASTVLFDDPERLYADKPSYARMGLGVHRELEAALSALEGGQGVQLAPSGLAACALAIACLVEAGDHVLIADTLYGPTRRFCEKRLKRMGVEVTRFPPRIGRGIERLFQPNTRAVYLESPGSLTFEIMDTPALVEAAGSRDIYTVIDNTWSGGLYHQPLALGVDLSVQALTKYAIGHADGFGGAVMARSAAVAQNVSECAGEWGIALGPEEAWLALRGLRTLSTRLRAHDESARKLAAWLEARPEVARLIHPAFDSHPDHAIWKRDFTGASGLFGFVLQPQPDGAVNAFLRALDLFGMGFSWGGFESLLIPCDPQLRRLPGDWTQERPGPLMRIHVGLEDPDDLIADLEAAMQHLSAG